MDSKNQKQQFQQKQYSGSGVMIWENYFDKETNQKKLAIIIFGQQRKSGLNYEECGGGISYQEQFKETAVRELQEESLNLFQLPQSYLLSETSVVVRNYICYNILIDDSDIDLKYFYINKDILNEGKKLYHIPSCWFESSQVIRVFVKDLLNQGILDDLPYHNFSFQPNEKIQGKKNIKRRCWHVIKQVFEQGIIDPKTLQIKLKPFSFQINKQQFKNAQQFLNNTFTYTIIENKQVNQLQSLQQQEKPNQTISGNEDLQQIMTTQQQNTLCLEQSNNYQQKELRKGAGIMLLTFQSEQDKTNNELSIICFMSKKKKIFSEGGGNKSQHDNTMMETACRELREESANLFQICPNSLNIENHIQVKNYTCFIQLVEFQNCTLIDLAEKFKYNNQIIDKSNSQFSKDWKGKQEMRAFKINNLIDQGLLQCLDNDSFNCNDNQGIEKVQGQYLVFRNRTVNVLKAIIKEKADLLKNIQKSSTQYLKLDIQNEPDYIFNEGFQFLKGTFYCNNVHI